MAQVHKHINDVQKLVLDIIKVERNHRIPGTQRRENVVEHSFCLALICWKLFEHVKPPLDLQKILKYTLIHDFSERGQRFDINTFATKNDRERKRKREEIEFKKITKEFRHFKGLVSDLFDYEKTANGEALFVWTVDKMQAIVLGEIDGWRPYKIAKVNYKMFCKKYDEVVSVCSPYLREIFKTVYKNGSKTYFDNPRRMKVKF